MVLMRKHGVSYYKSTEVEIKCDLGVPSVSAPVVGTPPVSVLDAKNTIGVIDPKGPATAASAPPVEMEIPHHVNEVAALLKLSDNDLVDRLFPDGAPHGQTRKDR
jgi:hypothetical protein